MLLIQAIEERARFAKWQSIYVQVVGHFSGEDEAQGFDPSPTFTKDRTLTLRSVFLETSHHLSLGNCPTLHKYRADTMGSRVSTSKPQVRSLPYVRQHNTPHLHLPETTCGV